MRRTELRAQPNQIPSRESRAYLRPDPELSRVEHRVDSPVQIRSPKLSLSQERRWVKPRVASRAEPSRVKPSQGDPIPDLQCPARAKSSRVMESRAEKRALSRAAISSRTDPSFESGRFLYRALGMFIASPAQPESRTRAEPSGTELGPSPEPSQDEPSRTPHQAMPSRAEPNIRTDDSSFWTLIYPARSWFILQLWGFFNS